MEVGRIGLVVLTFLILSTEVDCDLSDFGGDVRQYMSLLQGSSAFSFSPQKDEEDAEKRRREMMGGDSSTGGSAMGDFGGDYGDYLKLLESNSALGFNPQADPIGDNQDMQSDIFGGGSTKKFWNMYKGSTSYDSFDDTDTEVIDELKEDSDEELLRISKEYQDPEDAPNASTKRKITKKGKTVIVAYKPSKSKMNEIYDALKSKKIGKITDLLEEITEKKKTRRENQSNDYEEDGYKGEAQHEKRKTKSYVEKEWIEFAKKIIEATPDPVVSQFKKIE